jgi:hypothetical protein
MSVVGDDVEIAVPIGLARLREVDVFEFEVVLLAHAVRDVREPAVVRDEGAGSVLAFEVVAEARAEAQAAG